MIYLVDFFSHESDFNRCLADIDTIINASINKKMRSSKSMFFGDNIIELIRRVEIAYVIYKKYNIPKQKEPLDFFYNRQDYVNFRENKSITKNNEETPYDSISKFFSFQSLKKWYDTLDTLWINMIDRREEIDMHEALGEDYVLAIRELFMRLTISLHHIYEIGEFPKYEINDQLEENVVSKNNNQNTNAATDSNDLDTQSSPEIRKPQIGDPHRDRILEELRKILLYNDLEGWQSECQILHTSIHTEHDDWNEAFKESHPGTTFYFCVCIHKIIKFIDENVRNICDPDKFQFKSITTLQSCQQFIHEGRVITLKYLSYSEISQPEYYLYQLFEELPGYEWEDKLNEIIEIYLSLDNNESFEGNGGYLKFLQQLQKCIELSFIIAFKDEIEFISPTESEKLEM
ncbi:hypothetical protein M472_16060 [Sphingobacterium paucimobilis HER1398]|uniref:Uncharacterized protein n=2 Tax=Sphingobacterium TaxID=28453 RepID=U2HQR0_9SPHI|nr:hypothetical protein M472_03490 [Sphingobacterium paucimobilis HER1398]ERJ60273.1 hypothetical protein M472_16060 [Sphingobacterium paucimobilis HER1398]